MGREGEGGEKGRKKEQVEKRLCSALTGDGARTWDLAHSRKESAAACHESYLDT